MGEDLARAKDFTGGAPDREGWEMIWRLGCRVADHALAELTTPYTAGIPVYRIVKEEYLRHVNNSCFEELQEALKRLDSLEKELKEMKQNK